MSLMLEPSISISALTTAGQGVPPKNLNSHPSSCRRASRPASKMTLKVVLSSRAKLMASSSPNTRPEPIHPATVTSLPFIVATVSSRLGSVSSAKTGRQIKHNPRKHLIACFNSALLHIRFATGFRRYCLAHEPGKDHHGQDIWQRIHHLHRDDHPAQIDVLEP